MSIPLPAELVRATATWTIGHAGSSGDLTGARGYVLAEPSAVAVTYPETTVLPSPVQSPISAGVMLPMNLIVNDPEVWNWKITPKLGGVVWPSFHIDVPAEGVDLAHAAITPGVGPVRTVTGKPGAPGKDGEPGEPGPEGPYGGTSVTDPQVASYITTDTETRAALDALTGEAEAAATGIAVAGHVAVAEASAARVTDPLQKLQLNTDGRRRFTLISGQPGQSLAVLNATVTPDTIRTVEGTQALRATMTGAVTATLQLVHSPTLVFGSASIVRALVWIDDPADIQVVTLSIRTSLNPVVQWVRASSDSGPLIPGWNLLSWKAADGATTTWGQALLTQVAVVTRRATSITLQSVWVEATPKAQILFIEDRGYQTFVDHGLPALRARDIPVTWALDPLLHGTNAGTKAEAITDAQVEQFYSEGDDMSIHAYAGEVTATMTAAQIRMDSLKSHQWLQDRGYARGRQWRAAWTQNEAPAHAASQPYYAAYATPRSAAGMETWPFLDPWNVSRWSVHGRTPAETDQMFTTLQRTNSLLVCYTHGIHADGGPDATPAEWSHFISKIDEGISGGWLEGTSFSRLLALSGGVLR